MKFTQNANRQAQKRARAFTLIELLVVIGIIGILAALIANLAGPAASKRKIARVQAELAELETVIDSYKEKLGSYPPSNRNTNNTATNQLFYELTGTVFNEAAGEFQTINGSETISIATLDSFFGTKSLANSSTDRSEVKNFFPALKATQYRELSANPDVEILVCPVEGPNDVMAGGKKFNPWHYNSRTPTRNPESYDLWAEILVGGKTIIVGNWKE